MENSKIFYNMTLSAQEEGLSIFSHSYICIKETQCVFFCVSSWDLKRLNCKPLDIEGETVFQKAKRLRIRVRHIHKDGSRIAFDTKEKAFQVLLSKKRYQIEHLKRDIKFLERALHMTDGKSFDDFEHEDFNKDCVTVLPLTKKLVHEYFSFN